MSEILTCRPGLLCSGEVVPNHGTVRVVRFGDPRTRHAETVFVWFDDDTKAVSFDRAERVEVWA